MRTCGDITPQYGPLSAQKQTPQRASPQVNDPPTAPTPKHEPSQVLLGAFARNDHGAIKDDLQAAYELFPILGERSKQPAGTFSGGEQQMLAMGRAMMSRPKLLMLDEPSMGLSPIMMQLIMSTVKTLRSQGTTILLVEQNARAALKLADKGYVLEVGHIVLDGTGDELLVSDEVRKAYLGED